MVRRTDDSTEKLRNNMKNFEDIIQERMARMRVVMATSKGARALTTESSYTGHMQAKETARLALA